MSEGVFVEEGGFFRPTRHAGGPWSPETLHGGPVSGLLAHVLESAELDPRFRWSRLQVDLLRPVPRAPLSATSEVVRSGRRLHVRQASLWDEDGRLLARAHVLALARQTIDNPLEGAGAVSLPPREGLPATHLFFEEDEAKGRSLPGFASMIELRRIRGIAGEGEGCGWVRIPEAIVAGRESSAWVRAAATSDFANGMSQRFLGDSFGYINADITIHFQREPVGEWIGVDSASEIDHDGLGWVAASLYDDDGRFGTVRQCLLIAPRYRG